MMPDRDRCVRLGGRLASVWGKSSAVEGPLRAPAHDAGVRERHARAHFACGQTLADFCKVRIIKLSHSRGSLHRACFAKPGGEPLSETISTGTLTRPRVHNFQVRLYSGAIIRILSGVRSSTPSPREGAVLVRERARRTARVKEGEAHGLPRRLLDGARALEVVEVRGGEARTRSVDLDAGRL